MLVPCSSNSSWLKKYSSALLGGHHGKGIRHIMQIQIHSNYLFFDGNALKAHPVLKNIASVLFQIRELFSQASQAENEFWLNPIVKTIEKMLHLSPNNWPHNATQPSKRC